MSGRKARACLALAALLGSSLGGGVAGAPLAGAAQIECEGDACQPLPAPPEEPVLGTAFLTGEVNPPPHYPKAGAAGPKRPAHHHRHGGHRPGKKHRSVGRDRSGG